MFYHEEFLRTLKTFDCPNLPSLLDLNVELLKHGALNVLFQMTFMPFMFADWTKLKANDIIGNDSEKAINLRKDLYNNPECKKFLQREMKSWVQKGWF